MSDRPGGLLRSRPRRQATVLVGLVTVAALAAGCTSAGGDQAASQGGNEPSASSAPSSSAPPQSAATVATNVARTDVAVDKVVKLTADQGTFESVTVRGGGKKLAGELSADKTSWTSTARLEPGTRYRVVTTAVDAEGIKATKTSSFMTQALSLKQQTYPSFVPLSGETVGVGMPVIVHFDVAVADKASIEKHLKVTNTSGQKGAWHWISDNEVHWRPVTYWKPGTDVTVTADVNSSAAPPPSTWATRSSARSTPRPTR